MVKGILLRVAADTKNPGVLGPIFEDGSFEFIPIAEEEGIESDEVIYSKMKGRHGKMLSDYLPKKCQHWVPHNDPEFIIPSYGDPTSKKNSLKKLDKGDFLFFNAGLTAHSTTKYPKRANYIIGYFTVDRVVDFSNIESKKKYNEEWALLQNNFHIGYRKQKDCFVVVGQKNKSALLSKAIPFTEMRPDTKGRPTVAITKKWEKILGIKGFVQRSLRIIPEIGRENLLEKINCYI